MDTAKTADANGAWDLVHDLVFGVPYAQLLVIEYLVAACVLSAFAALVVRIWRGDRFEAGPLKLERPDRVTTLETSVEAIGKDDRLKANVLWMFRERLSEANRIIGDGIDEDSVRRWCRGALVDVITALGDGGDDRHRASLWVRESDTLVMYEGMGFRQEAIDRATLPLASVAGTILATGVPHNTSDIDADEAFSPKPRSGRAYKSLLAVPVKSPTGTAIAALCVDAEASGYFDRDHEFFAGCFADLIALLATRVITGDDA